MKYIDYLKWRISLLQYKNVILFPIEKVVQRQKDQKTEINTSSNKGIYYV